MSDFVYSILTGNIAEIIGEDLFQPVAATVVAAWAILAFAGVVQVFSNIFAALFNYRAGRKL